MCSYLPVDKVSFPGIHDIEGITTMPVRLADPFLIKTM
jgi:hypothetical protein